jgi:hypothetical protein
MSGSRLKADVVHNGHWNIDGMSDMPYDDQMYAISSVGIHKPGLRMNDYGQVTVVYK